MEKIITQTAYDIPSVINRWVDLGLTDYDKSTDILVKIKHPKGFEDAVLKAIIKKGGPAVAIHKRINGKVLHPVSRVVLKVYQNVENVKEEIPKKETPSLNPEPSPKEEKPGILKNVLSGKIRPKDFKSLAIEQAEKRRTRLTRIRNEVNLSTALKPIGLDGKQILTGDDCDYSRGMGLIENLKKLEERHNSEAGYNSPSQKKLLYEFYNALSFSGIGIAIGLYVALGERTKGKGDLNYLSDWYRNELSKIYSSTSFGEIKKKGKMLANGFKPKKLRKAPNPGFSIKQAEKIIGKFFSEEFTNSPLRMSDLKCEVYQPIFFDDEQTRVYTKQETPNAKIVDVILNTGLDPLYFQSRKIEIGSATGDSQKISLGPTRRSFDLPIAQHNKNIKIVSLGCELTYQESEVDFGGMNPAQVAFFNKKKTYRLDWLDAQKYMEDHSSSVSYLRIEAAHRYGVMANSILNKDLDACVKSAEHSKFWSNGKKQAIEWS